VLAGFSERFTDPVYCLTRIVVGLMFACHGGQKILAFPPGGRIATSGLGWWAGWIELICGFLVAFGFLTRIAAFVASGEMAVAYVLVGFPGKEGLHGPITFERVLPLVNGTEAAVLYCWFFFFFVCYGAGRWSFDALIRKRSRKSPDASS
jgi:putative oxidoreductase